MNALWRSDMSLPRQIVSPVTDTRIQLDQQTVDELQPGCQIVELALCPIHGKHQHECDQPATWVLRARCRCGHSEITLICDTHRRDVPVLVGKCECGYFGTPAFISVEHI